MNDKQITDQTAFETAGIPTPPNQENIAATDGLSNVVEAIMDHVEDLFTTDGESTTTKE